MSSRKVLAAQAVAILAEGDSRSLDYVCQVLATHAGNIPEDWEQAIKGKINLDSAVVERVSESLNETTEDPESEGGMRMKSLHLTEPPDLSAFLSGAAAQNDIGDQTPKPKKTESHDRFESSGDPVKGHFTDRQKEVDDDDDDDDENDARKRKPGRRKKTDDSGTEPQRRKYTKGPSLSASEKQPTSRSELQGCRRTTLTAIAIVFGADSTEWATVMSTLTDGLYKRDKRKAPDWTKFAECDPDVTLPNSLVKRLGEKVAKVLPAGNSAALCRLRKHEYDRPNLWYLTNKAMRAVSGSASDRQDRPSVAQAGGLIKKELATIPDGLQLGEHQEIRFQEERRTTSVTLRQGGSPPPSGSRMMFLTCVRADGTFETVSAQLPEGTVHVEIHKGTPVASINV